jgi:hypothetical protein
MRHLDNMRTRKRAIGEPPHDFVVNARSLVERVPILAGCSIPKRNRAQSIGKVFDTACADIVLTQLRSQGIHLHRLRRAFHYPISRRSRDVRNHVP